MGAVINFFRKIKMLNKKEVDAEVKKLANSEELSDWEFAGKIIEIVENMSEETAQQLKEEINYKA